MLIQSSLPIEAEISFVFDHGKQEFLCNWMPGAETWQKCSKCDKRQQGVSGEAIPVTEGKRNNDNSCSLNFPRSCSQLSTISTMSKNSTPTFVYQQDLQHLSQTHNSGQNPRPYQRRKHLQNSIAVFSAQASTNTKRSDDCVSTPTFVYQRRKHPQNSIAVFSAQASANTKRSDGCVSAISSEAPSVAAEEKNVLSLVELENDAVRAPVMLPSECNRGALVSKSESISKCSFAEEPGPEEAQESDVRKIIDICCVNESCSSSKSNMELGSASLKTDVDDTGECSSSDALIMEELQNDLSEKDICISILRSEGLLEGVCPIGTRTFAESVTTSSYSSCLRSCKVCGRSETTLKMLICDNCEEAFHMSCCIPRIRKIPADDWFCHSCLKKKHKILKESETGRCRIATLKGELGPIASMLKDSEPYATSVRIGRDFQAEVPDWSGPITNDVDPIGEPMERDPSDCISWQKLNSHKPSRLSSIGNWLQCREIIEGLGEGVDGTICGKWRRAPLFEVQTDDWECFRSVLWDPAHADCAVPQELDTDQVLKHLKYIEMLRPRLDVKRRKLSCTSSASSQDLTENVKNVRTQ